MRGRREVGRRRDRRPRPYAVGEIAETFKKYPGVGSLLPAMGYGQKQMADLQATIDATPCDLVIVGTPIDLGRVITISKPNMRVLYDLDEQGTEFIDAIERAIATRQSGAAS